MTSGDAARVQKLLSVFRDRPVSVDPERLEQRRRRIVPRLRAELGAIHAGRRKKSRWLVAGALGAAAGVVLFAGTALRQSAPEPSAANAGRGSVHVKRLEGESVLVTTGGSHRLTQGETLAGPVGGELRTAATSSTRLATEQGVELALSGGTSVLLHGLELSQGERRVLLTRGEISCEVPKLPAGESFVVITPDSRVIVHGTAFSVRVSGSGGTCVRVRQGAVAVQQAAGRVELTADQTWGCEPAPRISTAPAPEAKPAAAVRESRALAPRISSKGKPSFASTPTGTLALETELLQAALAAEQQRDYATAQTRLRTLLSRYPDSPLAPEAWQALTRVSRFVDR